jgi:LytS/YehU family sensor histidine kinase
MKYSILITMTFGFGTSVFFDIRTRLQETTLALRTRELEKERALKLASEARLQSLESRVHPHFLFNALNSVAALIREDPERAELQIERISRFLRYALDRGASHTVTLEEELRMVRDYLEIEQTRFGSRLRFSLDSALEASGARIPPMAVQTLVENSVKYAVAPRREGGGIRVRADREFSAVRVEIWDDGHGFDPAARPAGHGLDLLEGRLNSLYGDAAGLGFRNGRGMSVSLKIPFAHS